MRVVCNKKTTSTGNTDSQLTDDSHFDSIYYPDLDSEMDSKLETTADITDLLPTEQMTKYLVFENQLNKLFKFSPDCYHTKY